MPVISIWFADQFNLEVVIKNHSDSREIFRGMVAAGGCHTVKDALGGNPRIKPLISNLHCESEHYRTSVLQQEVAEFRDKKLTFVCFDEVGIKKSDVS